MLNSQTLINGDWRLYVRDHAAGNTGIISEGWSLTIFTGPPVVSPGLILDTPACIKPDYDGDGRSDIGVYRATTGEWFIVNSSTGAGAVTVWGAPSALDTGDIAAPADYDGDGQTDIAIYRETTGTWFIRNSFSGTISALDFGGPSSLGLGDRPVPGDYDGDGLTDLAIYRASTGQWIIWKSNGSGITVQTWGDAGLGDYPARR